MPTTNDLNIITQQTGCLVTLIIIILGGNGVFREKTSFCKKSRYLDRLDLSLWTEAAHAFPRKTMNPQQQLAAELFLSHYDFVMRTVFRFAPMPDIVDDIIQDTFNEFVSNADRYDLQSDVRALLKAIARNIALRYWQQYQRNRSEILQRIGDHYRRRGEEQAQADNYDRKEWFQREQNLLEMCLERLSERSRRVIRLYYYEEQPLAEIARQYRISVTAVKQFVYRLRQKLRICIDKKMSLPRSERPSFGGPNQ